MQTKKQKQEKALAYWKRELARIQSLKSSMQLFHTTREDMVIGQIRNLEAKGIGK